MKTYLVEMERCITNFNNDITWKSSWAQPRNGNLEANEVTDNE